MLYLTVVLVVAAQRLGCRISELADRADDRGELSSQQVIWIAALATLALAVAAIVTNLVTAKANSIDLG